MTALVARYGPAGTLWAERPDLPRLPIRAWQVWNEPNLTRYWSQQPFARSYVTLLRAAHAAVRAADPARDRGARRAAERELDRAARDLQGGRRRALRRRRAPSLHAPPARRRAHDRVRPRRDAQARRRQAADLGHRAVLARGQGQGRPAGRLRGRRQGPGGAARRRAAAAEGARASGSRIGRVFWYTWLSAEAGPSAFDWSGLRRERAGKRVATPALAVFRRAARRLEGCAKAPRRRLPLPLMRRARVAARPRRARRLRRRRGAPGVRRGRTTPVSSGPIEPAQPAAPAALAHAPASGSAGKLVGVDAGRRDRARRAARLPAARRRARRRAAGAHRGLLPGPDQRAGARRRRHRRRVHGLSTASTPRAVASQLKRAARASPAARRRSRSAASPSSASSASRTASPSGATSRAAPPHVSGSARRVGGDDRRPGRHRLQHRAARSPRSATGARTPRPPRTGPAAARRARGRAAAAPRARPRRRTAAGGRPRRRRRRRRRRARAAAARARRGSCARSGRRRRARTGGRGRAPRGRAPASARARTPASTPPGTTLMRSGARPSSSVSSRARERRDGDHVARAARDQREQAPLPGGVGRRVPAGMAQRRGVVEHDDGARVRDRGEVGGAQERARPARAQRQDELLPRVAGAVGEARRGGAQDVVAAGAQRGQPRRELARPALDAAQLGPGGGARVDRDRRRHAAHA